MVAATVARVIVMHDVQAVARRMIIRINRFNIFCTGFCLLGQNQIINMPNNSALIPCFFAGMDTTEMMLRRSEELLKGGDDIPEDPVEVNHAVWLGGVSEDDHHELLRRNDVDFLPVMTLAGEHILRGVGAGVVAVEPEEGPVSVLAGRSGRYRVIHPAFGEDAFVPDAAIVQEKLAEAGIVAGGDIEVG